MRAEEEETELDERRPTGHCRLFYLPSDQHDVHCGLSRGTTDWLPFPAWRRKREKANSLCSSVDYLPCVAHQPRWIWFSSQQEREREREVYPDQKWPSEKLFFSSSARSRRVDCQQCHWFTAHFLSLARTGSFVAHEEKSISFTCPVQSVANPQEEEEEAEGNVFAFPSGIQREEKEWVRRVVQVRWGARAAVCQWGEFPPNRRECPPRWSRR